MMPFLLPLREGIMRLMERIFARQILSPRSVDRAAINSILVIRQHDQLGDFLLATPALRALREQFPAARIGVVVREYFQDVARMVPYVDEVLVFHERLSRWRWKKGRTFFRRLRDGWNLTVVLNTVSHSLTSDILASLSGARYILGSETRVFPGCTRNFLYNLLAADRSAGRHQSECNVDIVRHIGVGTRDYSPKIVVTEPERSAARRELEAKGLDPELRLVGLHIGAGKVLNRWPVSLFGELATRLTASRRAQIVLFWGPNEEQLRQELAECAGLQCIEVGHPDFIRLAALFTQCDALVCNDTGIMHLAAAAGVPLVAIFGPTNPEEWKPLDVRIVCLRARSGKTEDVPVAEVMQAVQEFVRFD